jgi:hypothetical protein
MRAATENGHFRPRDMRRLSASLFALRLHARPRCHTINPLSLHGQVTPLLRSYPYGLRHTRIAQASSTDQHPTCAPPRKAVVPGRTHRNRKWPLASRVLVCPISLLGGKALTVHRTDQNASFVSSFIPFSSWTFRSL